MASFQEILQEYVNLSYEDLLSLAKKNFAKIMPCFNSIAKDGNGGSVCVAFISACLAADGELSSLEIRFVNDVTNSQLTREELFNITQEFIDGGAFALSDAVYDACPAEVRGDLLSFCLCFCAVDETISANEVAFIKRLLN